MKTFSKSILITVLFFSGSAADAKPKSGVTPDGVSWSNEAFKQLQDLQKGVSQDVKQFVKDNPDWVADNFGGNAYNAKEFVRNLGKNLQHNFDVATNFWKEFFGLPYKPTDGMRNLCESPRICLGMQYIVGKSILENMPSDPALNFYLADTSDGGHNFILMLPKGAATDAETVAKYGIIFDPFYSQSGEPDEFMHFASESAYQGAVVRHFLTQEALEIIFGKDPFNPPPPPPPNPDPEPSPDPDPDPTPEPCVGDEWVMTAFMSLDSQGKVIYAQGLNFYPDSCVYKENEDQILQFLLIFLNAQPYSCVGVLHVPIGTDTSSLPLDLSAYQNVTCK